jgi:hypothetical protein
MTPQPLTAARRVTTTAGHSIGAYAAWNGDRLGLAWCDDSPGNQELYFQSFDKTGRADGEAMRVTTTPRSSSIPAIEPAGTRVALLWTEHDQTAADRHGTGRTRSQIVFQPVP